MSDEAFRAAWERVSQVEGWLTEAQARRLYESARRARSWIVEIGSHHGKSTLVLAAGKPADTRLLAIDPWSDPRWGGGYRDPYEAFRENTRGVDGIETYKGLSRAAAADWPGEPIDLLYIDGAHDYESVLADIDCWAPALSGNATVLIHDCFSSKGVTLAVLRRLFTSRQFRYVGRDGTLAAFKVQKRRLPVQVRLLLGLPYFARNLAVKYAMRKRWPRAVQLLGHEGPGCPY